MEVVRSLVVMSQVRELVVSDNIMNDVTGLDGFG